LCGRARCWKDGLATGNQYRTTDWTQRSRPKQRALLPAPHRVLKKKKKKKKKHTHAPHSKGFFFSPPQPPCGCRHGFGRRGYASHRYGCSQAGDLPRRLSSSLPRCQKISFNAFYRIRTQWISLAEAKTFQADLRVFIHVEEGYVR
jgi:hypothetical protein